MNRSDPQSRWAVKQLKKQQKLDREMKRCGMINERGILSPAYMRSFMHDTSGKMSNKQLAILAGLMITFAAIGGFAYYEMGHHDGGHHIVTPPAENHAPTIDSWNIQSGSYAPHVWINVSDDKSVENVILKVYDKSESTLIYSQEFPVGAKQKSIDETLDFSNCSLGPGEYKVKVVAMDNQGKQSSELEKMITLPEHPETTPVPPQVDKPWIYWDESILKWHVVGNATDKNADLKTLHIKMKYAPTNETVHEGSYDVNGSKGSAEMVGKFDTGTEYWVDIWAEDQAGHVSDVKSAKFTA